MSEPVRRKGIELRGWTLFGVGFGFVVIYLAFSPVVAGGIGFRLFFDLLDIVGVVMMIWAIAQGIAVMIKRGRRE
jgi:hypothetical protein